MKDLSPDGTIAIFNKTETGFYFEKKLLKKNENDNYFTIFVTPNIL